MIPYYSRDGITIYHGDCRDILPQLESVDLVLTDPPYNIDFDRNYYSNRKRKNWSEYVDAPLDYGLLSGEFMRLLQAPASAYICVGYDNYVDWYTAMSAAGFVYPGYLVWDKGNATWLAGNYGVKWKQRTELIMHFIKGRPTLAFPDKHNILAYNRIAKNEHPCQKPVPLMTELILQSSALGDLILDPFMGSGTTIVACKQLGRQAIGIEKEKDYVEIAVKRLAQEVLAL